jgi:uncharacterized protein (DUF2062 family)
MREALRELGANLWPGNLPPESAARSIATGVFLGLLPILGLPTPLCALAAAVFRLNLALVQAANYSVYPLQIALVIPFYRLGEWIYLNPGVARSGIWATVCHTLTAWLCVSAPVAIILYITLRGLLHFGSASLLGSKRSAAQGT